MKGTNEIHVNQATMIEALQEYFDERYEPSIEVTTVRAAQNNEYVVVVKEKEPRTP